MTLLHVQKQLEGAQKLLSAMPTEAIEDIAFPEQDAFVKDMSRFVAALCTRRAGKSNGLSLRYFRTLNKYPGCFCPYIALTRESARNIMWDILQEQDERFKIGAKFTESNLTMTTRQGSRLQLFGADMKNFIKRLRGIKTPGAAIDEAQDFGSHITSLVEDILEPSISDYSDGWLALTGTPGPIPHGLFYEITEQKKYGYSVHSWSLFNNPYLPNARAFVEELIKKKGWDSNHPTLLREWYGQWVLDLDALVFKYDASKNSFASLPPLTDRWRYVIGVDLGFDDSDAIAVIGWHEHDKRAYLVEEILTPHQGITDLAIQIEGVVRKYSPLKIVIDTGGLGKKIAEEMRSRYSIPYEAAEKTRKFEYIEILNDAMRTATFFARSDSRFAEDCKRVKWDQDALTSLKISDNFHSDISDATLYAYREALNWLSEPETPVLKAGTPEWMKREEEEMEDAVRNGLEREKRSMDPGSEAWND